MNAIKKLRPTKDFTTQKALELYKIYKLLKSLHKSV